MEVCMNEIKKEHSNQLYIQLVPEQDETVSAFCRRLVNILETEDYQVVKATCFGALANRERFESELEQAIDKQFPLTWVEGENCSNSFLNGIQLWAVKAEVIYGETNFKAKTSRFSDDSGHYLFIGDLLSEPQGNADLEYEMVLERLDQLLQEAGFVYTDVVRTWYYLDDILRWYDSFNRIRTAFFKQKGVFESFIPASTGVSGRNKSGSSVTMELLAFKPAKETAAIAQVKSPMQNEAGEYGSSFSRAIRVNSAGSQWMSISGTASILPSGETANIGNVKRQIQHSFEVVGQIVANEGYNFSNLVRATAYLKDKSSLSILHEFLTDNPQYQMPLVVTENSICRDDLLFEIEMDLVKSS